MKRLLIIAAVCCGHFFASAEKWRLLPTEDRCVRDICKADTGYYVLNTDGSLSYFDGNTYWRDIADTGEIGTVLTMCYANGKLYVAGKLENSKRNAQVGIWDGRIWMFSTLPTQGMVRKIIPRKSGGLFLCGSLAGSKVYQFDGISWTPLPTNDAVETIGSDEHDTVYAGGTIYRAGGRPVILKWTGTAWDSIYTDTLYGPWEQAITLLLYCHEGTLYTYSRHLRSIVALKNGQWNSVGRPLVSYPAPSLIVRSIQSDSAGVLYAAVNLNFSLPHDAYVAKYVPSDTTWEKVGDLTPFTIATGWEIVPLGNNRVLYLGLNCFLGVYDHERVKLPEVGERSRMYLYPNPAEKIITVTAEEVGEYRILNARGETCQGGRIEKQLPKTIDIESLPAGLYIFQCGTGFQKFIVAR